MHARCMGVCVRSIEDDHSNNIMVTVSHIEIELLIEVVTRLQIINFADLSRNTCMIHKYCKL